jgi:hypothetical protein
VRPTVPLGKRAAAADCNQKQLTTIIFDRIVVASDGVGSNFAAKKRPTASDQNEQSLRHGLINDADRQKHRNRGSALVRTLSFCSIDPMGFAAGW